MHRLQLRSAEWIGRPGAHECGLRQRGLAGKESRNQLWIKVSASRHMNQVTRLSGYPVSTTKHPSRLQRLRVTPLLEGGPQLDECAAHVHLHSLYGDAQHLRDFRVRKTLPSAQQKYLAWTFR